MPCHHHHPLWHGFMNYLRSEAKTKLNPFSFYGMYQYTIEEIEEIEDPGKLNNKISLISSFEYVPWTEWFLPLFSSINLVMNVLVSCHCAMLWSRSTDLLNYELRLKNFKISLLKMFIFHFDCFSWNKQQMPVPWLWLSTNPDWDGLLNFWSCQQSNFRPPFLNEQSSSSKDTFTREQFSSKGVA